MTAPTDLEQVLTDACRWAKRHGLEEDITPTDFAVQQRPPGTHAAYVGPGVVVVVLIDRTGKATFGFADLEWVHYPDSEYGTEPCDEECDDIPPMRTVYLPGDGPARTSVVDGG